MSFLVMFAVSAVFVAFYAFVLHTIKLESRQRAELLRQKAPPPLPLFAYPTPHGTYQFVKGQLSPQHMDINVDGNMRFKPSGWTTNLFVRLLTQVSDFEDAQFSLKPESVNTCDDEAQGRRIKRFHDLIVDEFIEIGKATFIGKYMLNAYKFKFQGVGRLAFLDIVGLKDVYVENEDGNVVFVLVFHGTLEKVPFEHDFEY